MVNRTSALPQVNLSLLRSNSLKIQPLRQICESVIQNFGPESEKRPINYEHCLGFGLDPDSIRLMDPYPDS
jgi:hypothetical protein